MPFQHGLGCHPLAHMCASAGATSLRDSLWIPIEQEYSFHFTAPMVTQIVGIPIGPTGTHFVQIVRVFHRSSFLNGLRSKSWICLGFPQERISQQIERSVVSLARPGCLCRAQLPASRRRHSENPSVAQGGFRRLSIPPFFVSGERNVHPLSVGSGQKRWQVDNTVMS